MKEKIISTLITVSIAGIAALAVAAVCAMICLRMPDPAVGILPSALVSFFLSAALCGYMSGKSSAHSPALTAIKCVTYFGIILILSFIVSSFCMPEDSQLIPSRSGGEKALTFAGGAIACFIAALLGARKKSHGRSHAKRKKGNSITARMKARSVGR